MALGVCCTWPLGRLGRTRGRREGGERRRSLEGGKIHHTICLEEVSISSRRAISSRWCCRCYCFRSFFSLFHVIHLIACCCCWLSCCCFGCSCCCRCCCIAFTVCSCFVYLTAWTLCCVLWFMLLLLMLVFSLPVQQLAVVGCCFFIEAAVQVDRCKTTATKATQTVSSSSWLARALK